MLKTKFLLLAAALVMSVAVFIAGLQDFGGRAFEWIGVSVEYGYPIIIGLAIVSILLLVAILFSVNKTLSRIAYAWVPSWFKRLDGSGPELDVAKNFEQDNTFQMFRLRVTNDGPGPATGVVGRLIEVRGEDGKPVNLIGYLPIVIHWSNSNETSGEILIREGDFETLGVLHVKHIEGQDAMFVMGLSHNRRELKIGNLADFHIQVRPHSNGALVDRWIRVRRDSSGFGYVSEPIRTPKS